MVRLASLGAVWQQGVIPQVQTTRWTGGPDLYVFMAHYVLKASARFRVKGREKEFI